MQIPLLLKGVDGGNSTASAMDACTDGTFTFPTVSGDTLSPTLGGLLEGGAQTAVSTGCAADPNASSSSPSKSDLDSYDANPPKMGEPWLPLKERKKSDDIDAPYAGTWLPPSPEPALLPPPPSPPPPPRPRRDPSLMKPPPPWNQGTYATAAAPYPPPLPSKCYRPPIPSGMNGVPIHIPRPWVHGPAGWYPTMSAPPPPQPYLYHQRPLPPAGIYPYPVIATGGMGGSAYAPAAAAAAVAAVQAGMRAAGSGQNGGVFAPASASTPLPTVAANAAAACAVRRPVALAQQHNSGAGAAASTLANRAGKRARVQTLDALSTGLAVPVTTSAARWAGEVPRARPEVDTATQSLHCQPQGDAQATSATAALAAATALAAAVAAATAMPAEVHGVSDSTRPTLMTLGADSEKATSSASLATNSRGVCQPQEREKQQQQQQQGGLLAEGEAGLRPPPLVEEIQQAAVVGDEMVRPLPTSPELRTV